MSDQQTLINLFLELDEEKNQKSYFEDLIKECKKSDPTINIQNRKEWKHKYKKINGLECFITYKKL